MEYYAAIGKDEIMQFAITWMELEGYYVKLSKSEGERLLPMNYLSVLYSTGRGMKGIK